MYIDIYTYKYLYINTYYDNVYHVGFILMFLILYPLRSFNLSIANNNNCLIFHLLITIMNKVLL